MHKLPFLIILIFSISLIPFSFSDGIPDWVKNNASWWSDRLISQSEFTNGLEFLINEGIIYVPSIDPLPPGPEKIIPDWVRTSVGWWSDDLIPDSEFINAMKYLIEIGLIEVDATTPISENVDANIDANIESMISPLNVVLDGNLVVHANKNFIMDIKVFDSENYSGNEFSILRKGLDDVSVNIQLFNHEGKLIHNYDDMTKYNGLVEYAVHAKETSAERGLWLINNNYSVKVSASFNEQYGESYWEFVGIPDEYAYTQGSQIKKPVSLTATAGNDQVSLSWSAPANVADITDYRIEYCKIDPTAAQNPNTTCPDPDSGNYWTAFAHDPTDIVGCNTVTIERTAAEGGDITFTKCDADLSDVVTGLEDSTQYLFRVAAINYSGTGAYSATVTATTT